MKTTIASPTPGMRRSLRWALVGMAILLLIVLVSGCSGPATQPLAGKAFTKLGDRMAEIERTTDSAQLDTVNKQLIAEGRRSGAKDKDTKARVAFLRGYIAEYRQSLASTPVDERDYSDASARYQEAIKLGTGYAAQARYRLGILGANNLLDTNSMQTAKTELQYLSRSFGADRQVWVRNPEIAGEDGAATLGSAKDAGTRPVLYPVEAATVATQRLDTVYPKAGGSDAVYYRIADVYVNGFKKITPVYGAALALILLALIMKLVTIPLTVASFRGMRDMQRVQPLLKEIQEKYKDDRAKLAEAQMQLMKEHKVSPMGGCLPMLIQLPIFFVVYRIVQVYGAGFADAQFLWISNLARPDIILLILYAISMVVTQKLTATPATDQQQKMMQQQMTYMMPVMLFFVLMQMASAFVLYWFFLNVFSAIHQYYMMKQFQREDEARGVVTPSAPAPTKKKKGK